MPYRIVEELERHSRLLDKIEEMAGIGHWHIDLTTNKLFWSDSIYKIYGVQKEDITLSIETAISFYHPDDREMISKYVDETINEQKGFRFEARLIQPSGSIRNVVSYGEPLLGQDGKLIGLFGVFNDITDIIHTKAELERSNKDLQDFAFTVSHDLKAPLRHISMSAEFIQQTIADKLDDTQKEFFQIMIDGAQKAQIMIDSLLEYSRIDRADTDFIPIDLNIMINGILSLLSFELEDAGAEVSIDTLPSIKGNEGLLMRLFQNIIENALKYQKKDNIPKLKIYSRTLHGVHEIYIQDNGIGIDPVFGEKIFLMFQRLHSEDSEYEGLGIGLSICLKIARAHGGDIKLDTSYQDGARFIISLPAL